MRGHTMLTELTPFCTSVPRTTLHSLEPFGLGTLDVESLLSYFCRLANSHACSTNDLAQAVVNHIAPARWTTKSGIEEGKSRFQWHQRSISGVSDAALSWSSALSSLTGIPRLDRLTLLPLRSVLAPKRLMTKQARWCPQCFQDDYENQKTPYFRLAWDIGSINVCAKHESPLIASCPHCKRSNVRHAASYVVPGWCSSCGHFLGEPAPENQQSCSHQTPDYEQAHLIGKLLAATSSPSTDIAPNLQAMHQALVHLILEMDGGIAAHFGRRLGVRKTTVHHWQKSQSPLTLDTHLRIAKSCQVGLLDFMQGKLDDWQPPSASCQLALKFDNAPTPTYSRRKQHDWDFIRLALEKALKEPVPRSVAEIARSLDIDERLLYIQETSLTRRLGERYVNDRRTRSVAKQQVLHEQLFQACREIKDADQGITVENVAQLVDAETLNATHSLYSVLSNMATHRPMTH